MNTYRVWFSDGSAIMVNAETETDARASEAVRNIIYNDDRELKLQTVETLN